MKILALSGSLRSASLNSALLRSTVRLAPPGISVRLFAGIGDLPLFNPDLEATWPPPVAALTEAVATADALIIASPEYAHGISGVMKNALDWLVGGDAFVNKPVALFNASPRSTYALTALREVIAVMSGRLVAAADLELPIRGSGLDEHGIGRDPAMSTAIRTSLLALQHAVQEFRQTDNG
ncbi:NAD(P)H-dependent oxidoreductase [Permianibacter sp. IMCC34836]|nr:NAD(P)H-dependent oxidoreductase [Permianibacter fluminis]